MTRMHRTDRLEDSHTLAVVSSAGAFVSLPLVFTASRGSVLLLAWSASFPTLAFVATIVKPSTLPAVYIFPTSPRLVILKGLVIFEHVSCVIGMSLLVYAMVGHDIARQDLKNQRLVATFTTIMSVIVTSCGLLLRSSHASPLQDEEKTETQDSDSISRTSEAKPVTNVTPTAPSSPSVVPGSLEPWNCLRTFAMSSSLNPAAVSRSNPRKGLPEPPPTARVAPGRRASM